MTQEATRVNHLGTQWTAELYGCDARLLDDVDAISALMLAAASVARATIVGSRFHRFAPHGVSGVVIIAESHLAIHTWPERESVTIDVYVCNFTTDNTAKAESVFRSLERTLRPKRTRFQAIHRGGADG